MDESPMIKRIELHNFATHNIYNLLVGRMTARRRMAMQEAVSRAR